MWRYFFKRSDSRNKSSSSARHTNHTNRNNTHKIERKCSHYQNSYHEGSQTFKLALATQAIAYSIHTLERVYQLMLCSISEARPLDDPSGTNQIRHVNKCIVKKIKHFVSKKNITPPPPPPKKSTLWGLETRLALYRTNVRSTSETTLLSRSLKLADFHNQSPLLTTTERNESGYK